MLAAEVQGLSKTFGKKSWLPWASSSSCDTRALDNVSLKVPEGEMVALIGASGPGKSTLLRHLSGLVTGDRGKNGTAPSVVKVLDRTVQVNGELNTKIRRIRADVGFIFQQFNLVGRLSLLTNVLMGMLARVPSYRTITRCFTRQEKMVAMEALDRVGMAECAAQRASTLSGGQQQRGAIARALVQRAKVILADEPIASLDPASSTRVMEALRRINQEDGVTVMVSLHQVGYAMTYCDRSVALKDGRILYDGPSKDLNANLLRDLYGSEFGDLEEGAGIEALVARTNGHRATVKSAQPERDTLQEASAYVKS